MPIVEPCQTKSLVLAGQSGWRWIPSTLFRTSRHKHGYIGHASVCGHARSDSRLWWNIVDNPNCQSAVVRLVGGNALRGVESCVGPSAHNSCPYATIGRTGFLAEDASLLRALLQIWRHDFLEALCGLELGLVRSTSGAVGAIDGKIFPPLLPSA